MMRDKCLTEKLNYVLSCLDLKCNFCSSSLIKYDTEVTLVFAEGAEGHKMRLSYVLSLSPTV